MEIAVIKPVATVEPDYTRCRALVLSGPPPGKQCSRHPWAYRQHQDGQVYAVCRQHKQARWFVPWTAASLMSQLDASRAFNRVILNLRHGAPKPRLV